MDNDVLKKKTISVIIITLIMMVAEIYFGIITNSMSLTADGVHMGTHVLAFVVTLIVCLFAVKLADKAKTLNALGSYTSAILLGFTSVGIIYESFMRFIHPHIISFEDAILVAIIGLLVNILCIFIMGKDDHHQNNDQTTHNHSENLNYKAAYFHILADIMTSVLAIGALVLGKFFGLNFLDPVIGVFGGIIIAKWAIDLLVSSGNILIDNE